MSGMRDAEENDCDSPPSQMLEDDPGDGDRWKPEAAAAGAGGGHHRVQPAGLPAPLAFVFALGRNQPLPLGGRTNVPPPAAINSHPPRLRRRSPAAQSPASPCRGSPVRRHHGVLGHMNLVSATRTMSPKDCRQRKRRVRQRKRNSSKLPAPYSRNMYQVLETVVQAHLDQFWTLLSSFGNVY